MAKRRLAIIVQRCHESIVGGSEALAWLYAKLLSEEFAVDIITTTALESTTWKNELGAGEERCGGITLRRFETDFERTEYFHRLNRLLNSYFTKSRGTRSPLNSWRPALQEEFLRFQGPYSTTLLRYLEREQGNYDVIVFFTYLFATTYFGLRSTDPERTILVPTLHDEPPAYMSVYRSYVGYTRQMIWLTEAEYRLGKRLWDAEEGPVVGIPIDVPKVEPQIRRYPYLLYSGRIDPSKGCEMLIDGFLDYKTQNPSNLKLVLTGDPQFDIKDHPDIIFEGRVDNETKFQLMKGALTFVMPSKYESFSIATLEAMGQGTPVLVNGNSEVLRDHVLNSGAGRCFQNESEFGAALDWVFELGDSERTELSSKGKQYVQDHYSLQKVREKLIAVLS
ncbi:MAG TPA: glycosyltransferase family 4 protein [Acidobacteriota bacterium]|nr:glycosyltransferase family 4 protein [Acidobacteriota bacterium]